MLPSVLHRAAFTITMCSWIPCVVVQFRIHWEAEKCTSHIIMWKATYWFESGCSTGREQQLLLGVKKEGICLYWKCLCKKSAFRLLDSLFCQHLCHTTVLLLRKQINLDEPVFSVSLHTCPSLLCTLKHLHTISQLPFEPCGGKKPGG